MTVALYNNNQNGIDKSNETWKIKSLILRIYVTNFADWKWFTDIGSK